MKRSTGFSLLLLSVAVCCLLTISALADSNIRIVRLSSLQGTVEIDRATGQGFERAFLNMPITHGVKLKTGDDGRAEVELEDNTVLHLVPNSTLEFTDLSLLDSGARVSTVDFKTGEVYVNFTGRQEDEFAVTFGHEKTTLRHAAHFRLRMDETKAELAVFDGDVQVDGPRGEVKLSKKETATFDFSDNDQFKVAKNLEQDPFDDWDKQAGVYHQRYEASNSYGSPYSYGMNDLNYYGNFMTVPGYGMCWQPYFTGMGWNPYMDGGWLLYPGFGYSWVSAYPWGWTPYHYGSWIFAPGYGWVWQPGNTWVAWNRLPPVINPPHNYIPPRAPVMNQPSMVSVGRGPTSSSLMPGTKPGSKLVLDAPTAGLGVPRGINNLSRLNRDFQAHGQTKFGIPGNSTSRAMMATPVYHGGGAMRVSGSEGHWGSMSAGHAASSSGHASGGTSHK